MQNRRYGKDQMKIPAYRQAAFQLIYPYELFGILAFVAVPVPAGVVSDSLMITLATLLKMTAHGGSPALADSPEGLKLVRT